MHFAGFRCYPPSRIHFGIFSVRGTQHIPLLRIKLLSGYTLAVRPQ